MRRMKRTVAWMLTLAMMLTMVMPTTVQAKNKAFPESITMYKMTPASTQDLYVLDDESDITDLESSAPKVAVAEVKTDEESGRSYVEVTAKKVGTATISCKLSGNNEKMTVKVVKWSNPCKTLKIGSKDYAKKYKSTDTVSINLSKKKGTKTIQIAPKSGWKLHMTDGGLFMSSKKKFKMDLTRVAELHIGFINKKTKEEVWLNVF